MWPYVQINNLNQMQGPVTEVERHLLFVGSAASNTGKLLSLNTQSDFDQLLGAADSELKANLQAAMANAGQNWTAAAVLPTDMDWKEAVRNAQKPSHSRGRGTGAGVGSGQHQCRPRPQPGTDRQVGALAVHAAGGTGIAKEQDWSTYETELATLQEGIKAESVSLIPQLFTNLVGAYAGRLSNRSVSVADSPCRVKTGAVVGLGNKPKDKDGVELPLATLQTLEQNRYSVPMWYPDYDGTYWADSRTLDAGRRLPGDRKPAGRLQGSAPDGTCHRPYRRSLVQLHPGAPPPPFSTLAKTCARWPRPSPSTASRSRAISPPQGWRHRHPVDRQEPRLHLRGDPHRGLPQGITVNIMLDLSLNNGEG